MLAMHMLQFFDAEREVQIRTGSINRAICSLDASVRSPTGCENTIINEIEVVPSEE